MRFLNGRATRNFLALLCLMEFVLFIDRVNLAAAAPVMRGAVPHPGPEGPA